MKAKTLMKMKNYYEIINILKRTDEYQLLYYLGYAYYKINDYSNSLISL